LHDLVGKRLGVPVWRLLGLDPARAPLSSYTLGLDEPERMRDRLRETAGYPILKVKLGTPRDEEVLRLIREERPDAVVRVDANTAWSAKEAIARLPLLEEHGVELLEQPVPAGDIEGLRRVREHTDRKSTRLNSSHVKISYAVFCLKKKTIHTLSPSSTLFLRHSVSELFLHCCCYPPTVAVLLLHSRANRLPKAILRRFRAMLRFDT